MNVAAPLARLAASIYYRLSVEGRLPPAGPVLIVANHPNSLVDPVLVLAAARRPVRFLAKAPLFDDRRIAWMLKLAGAVPVYRPQDDPALLGRNAEVLEAAARALAGGAAVAVFPEGRSHDEPELSPLKTGAARMALLAAQAGANAVIVPVGLNLRQKELFRSDALVLVGEPLAWADLGTRGVDDAEAVRELTGRMDDALRHLTLNVERWEDAPVIECAEEVWRVEHGAPADEHARLERLRVASTLLTRIRSDPRNRWAPIARAARHHARTLNRLHLTPADLESDLSVETAIAWSLRRLPLLLLPMLALAAAGLVLWWLPYRLTGMLAGRMPGGRDVQASHKLLVGSLLYLLWYVGAIVAGLLWGGPLISALVAVLLPVVGVVGLWIRERWAEAWRDARRYFILRRHPRRVRELQRRQRELADAFRRMLSEDWAVPAGQ